MNKDLEKILTTIAPKRFKEVSLVIYKPSSRQTPRTLNGVFIKEEDETNPTIFLEETNSQFLLWRLKIEAGLIIYDGKNYYRVEEASFLHYPKFPIISARLIPEPDELKASSKARAALVNYRRFGIS